MNKNNKNLKNLIQIGNLIKNAEGLSIGAIFEQVKGLTKFVEEQSSEFQGVIDAQNELQNSLESFPLEDRIKETKSDLSEDISKLKSSNSKELKEVSANFKKLLVELQKEIKRVADEKPEEIIAELADEDIQLLVSKIEENLSKENTSIFDKRDEALRKEFDGKFVLPEDTKIMFDGIEKKIKEGLGGSTARNFYQLFDTPSSFVGAGGKTVSVKSDASGLEFTTAGGAGDMTKAVYDPTTVAGDAFDMDNMAEGATTKILTGTERTQIATNKTNADASKIKTDFISVTQAVDLDTMESDIATNNAKVTNATHTGEVTGSGALTLDKTAISGKADTIITASDTIIFGDATDTDNLKKDTVQGILDFSASRDFLNGTFAERFNALVTSDGAIVTATITNAVSGDITGQFSSGNATFTGGSTIVLTAGSDASPTGNFIYVLESAPNTLVKSTSAFPTGTEHIKIAYFLVPSAGFVQTNGVYINHNWNDEIQDTNNQGHLSHVTERQRRMQARYFSGIGENGTSGYLTPTAGNVELKSTSGIVYQLHPHTFPAFDTSTGDIVLVKNWSGDSFHDITNLYDIVDDSTGTTIGNNKFFNLTLWGVVNKSGEMQYMMVNLPGGFYNSQTGAENDTSGFDDLTIPNEFLNESSTGFLIARLTIQMKTGGGTWILASTVDLRGLSPQAATGGTAAGTVVNFADNQFTIFDETDITKIIDFDAGANITTGNTRTITMADTDIDLTNVPTSGEKTVLGNTSGTNTGDEVTATTTTEGVVEKSTSAENVTGTSDTVYPTVAGTKEMIDTHAGGGGGEWSLVASNRLGADATTLIDATGISGFDIFRIKVYWKSAVNGSNLQIQLNADTGSNYGYQQLIGNTTSATANETDSDTAFTFMQGFGVNSGAYSQSDITISKPVTGFEAGMTAKTLHNETFGNTQVFEMSGAWDNTSAKITGIKLFVDQTNGAAQDSVVLIEGATIT